MGGRGRWNSDISAGAGGTASYADSGLATERDKAERSWEQEQNDFSQETDWIEHEGNLVFNDGDLIFKWVGMKHHEAETYFNDNIKPFLEFYENDGNYGSAISHIDRYVIDDYQLGKVVQDYRDVLMYRMDMK